MCLLFFDRGVGRWDDLCAVLSAPSGLFKKKPVEVGAETGTELPAVRRAAGVGAGTALLAPAPVVPGQMLYKRVVGIGMGVGGMLNVVLGVMSWIWYLLVMERQAAFDPVNGGDAIFGVTEVLKASPGAKLPGDEVRIDGNLPMVLDEEALGKFVCLENYAQYTLEQLEWYLNEINEGGGDRDLDVILWVYLGVLVLYGVVSGCCLPESLAGGASRSGGEVSMKHFGVFWLSVLGSVAPVATGAVYIYLMGQLKGCLGLSFVSD